MMKVLILIAVYAIGVAICLFWLISKNYRITPKALLKFIFLSLLSWGMIIFASLVIAWDWWMRNKDRPFIKL